MNHIIPREAPPAEAVRAIRCTLCFAPPGRACQEHPRADHVQRWLDACRAGLVGKAEVGEAVSAVTIITKWQVVPERAA
ncbi:MAG: hypothetical protein ACLQDY_22100 [Streptosporangiaceae bacterium]